jgi:hypothetical protein
MPTYFGANTTSWTSSGNDGAIAEGNNDASVHYTCPGSGNQVVSEISLYCDNVGVSGNIRLAIYSADKSTLICQGTGAVAPGATTSWQGHLSAASITPNPAVLVGGTNYTIVYSADAGQVHHFYNGSGSFYNSGADYTGGFPASISLPSNSGGETSIRAGVDPQPLSNSPKPSLILQAVARASYY